LRLIALVERPDHVCARYRLAPFRPYLERAGHALEIRAWSETTWGQLRHQDAVIVQRKFPAFWQRFLLRRGGRKLLFDFDDAVWLRDSYSAKGLHCPRRLRRFAATVRAADAVLAGNAFLLTEAARWTPASRVHVVPTCVEPASYPLAHHQRAGDGVELVWIGSSSTLQGLEAVRPLLEEIGCCVPGVRLKLICDRFLKLDHLPVVPCPWAEATETADLASADIGMSWIPPDLWSRGKCGLKVLQYMAAGLPVVANPVGVQADMVRHGVNGYLAESPAEWVEAVRRLARDPELRRRLGQAGRRRVEEEFSVRAGAGLWLSVLDGLMQRKEAA
jgi:glycosyltransferase involved in cell wall biosynthesis